MPIVFALLLWFAVGAVPAQAFDAAGYEKAIATIRCDCGCHPQSLKDCACGYAAEKRDEIRGMMTDDASRAGLSGEAVVAKFIADHGEQIRISPPARGFNLVAWLGPLVVLGLAFPALIMMLRRWQSAHARLAPATEAAPPVELDDEYASRLRKQLEEME